jgi:hypothetical protein
MAYDWTFPGRAEMVKSALDVLNVCATVPKAQVQFCELIDLPEDTKPVGINILLSAAEGEIVQVLQSLFQLIRMLVLFVRYSGSLSFGLCDQIDQVQN